MEAGAVETSGSPGQLLCLSAVTFFLASFVFLIASFELAEDLWGKGLPNLCHLLGLASEIPFL